MNISIITLAVVFLLIAVRQIGNTRLKIWQVMLCGAMTVMLTGEISPRAAFQAINFDVIFFLIGMFIIGQAIEDSGYLTHLCHKFFGKVKSVDKLVLAILLTMGIGSAFLMNDTLAIIGTPMMILLAKSFLQTPAIRMPQGSTSTSCSRMNTSLICSRPKGYAPACPSWIQAEPKSVRSILSLTHGRKK